MNIKEALKLVFDFLVPEEVRLTKDCMKISKQNGSRCYLLNKHLGAHYFKGGLNE